MAVAERELIPGVEELTAEEGRAILDRQAQHYLHMSADAFIEKWDRGDFGPAWDDDPDVRRVALLLPLGR